MAKTCSPLAGPSPLPPSAPALSPVEAKIAELTDQFSRLTLLIQASLTGNPNIANAPGTAASAMARPGHFRERCRRCDSWDHIRKFCPAFMETLRNGLVRFDDQYHLLSATTGIKIPPNYEGKKLCSSNNWLFPPQLKNHRLGPAVPLQSLSNLNTLTLATENSVMLITLYDDGTARHDISMWK